MNFKDNFQEQIQHFNQFAEKYFSILPSEDLLKTELYESMMYSFNSGGKRYRPLLCYSFAEAFGCSPKQVDHLALAVEMIHTYSLIHDDLPCMDNDDFRRGLPTNHKKFNEATALLAGDALLTESFRCLALGYSYHSDLLMNLIQLLSFNSGFMGMILGQTLDIKIKDSKITNFESLLKIHLLKTGKLMAVCLKGSAMCMGLPDYKIHISEKLGEEIGIYFQLVDDIDDVQQGKDELSVVHLLGLDASNKKVAESYNRIQILMKDLELKEKTNLSRLIEFIRPASLASNIQLKK